MRGRFELIVGKTISAVYCRNNTTRPQGQIFLLFDDDTYFEIYESGALSGSNGVDKGDLNHVINLSQHEGCGEIFCADDK